MCDDGSAQETLWNSNASPYDDAMLAGAEGYAGVMDETGFPQPVFEDDFYREPTDHVMRGVSLPSDLGLLESIGSDFYREPTDLVMRGVSLPSDVGGLPILCQPTVHPSLDAIDSPFDKPQDEITRGVVLHADVPAEASAFLPEGELIGNAWYGQVGGGKHPNSFFLDVGESHKPPVKPANPHWRYQLTHFFLDTEQPFQIGDALLSFFTGSLVSDIKKVKHQKFSIKAEVFVDNVACTLKVRIYAEPHEHRYCVEFQRRSGDCVTFSQVYQDAARFLKAKFSIPDVEPQAKPSPTLPSGIQSKDEIGPLLAMVDVPELQAESAAALAKIAQHRSVASLLCTPDACKEYVQLLKSDSTAVTYATACLLSRLVLCPEASELFGQYGFTQLMEEKAQAKSTPEVVQGKLQQALRSLICR